MNDESQRFRRGSGEGKVEFSPHKVTPVCYLVWDRPFGCAQRRQENLLLTNGREKPKIG